jgi:endonuclease III
MWNLTIFFCGDIVFIIVMKNIIRKILKESYLDCSKEFLKEQSEINESVNKKFITDFLFDFGMLITMGFSQITKRGVNQKATNELTDMMKRLREPLINGKTYTQIIDDISLLYNNPKLLSALMGQIRELLSYIEPRVKNYVKDCDVKDNWLGKIDKFKERYKEIVS